jgi:uncharacterized membrane protein
MTKHQLLISAAAAGLMAASFASVAGATSAAPAAAPAAAAPTTAAAPALGKCYGIAKAGQNACASATGTHACKGLAKVDKDPGDFTLASADDCAKAGGKTTAPEAKK